MLPRTSFLLGIVATILSGISAGYNLPAVDTPWPSARGLSWGLYLFAGVSCNVPQLSEAGFWKEVGKSMVNTVKTFFDYEVCDRPWLHEDLSGLKHFLNNRLHGQHLVVEPLLRSIRGHLSHVTPEKALVLSMHGSTGNGKNYVSRAVAESLYKKGMDSRFVHQFTVTSDFPHESKVSLYQDQLRTWISRNASECHRNLFIFDEIDRMPPGVMDAIKPYIDHYTHIGRIDYRRNIFLFLGNIGGKQINDYTLTQWQKSRKREDIGLKEVETILTRTAFNEQGGLWHSRLIDHNLVSAFIPFLPMERQHVRKCVEDDLRRKGRRAKPGFVDQVTDELEYVPADLQIYSSTGCKRVSQRVDLLTEEAAFGFGHDEF